jgi:hypothetical protein
MSSVVIFRKRGTFWISTTGASLCCCLSGVINLGSAECHYCRSRMVVQNLEFVFHCLKIFKACRTFFPSYGLFFWLVLLSFQDFFIYFSFLDCRQFKRWCRGERPTCAAYHLYRS